jgi:hypothetical protein
MGAEVGRAPEAEGRKRSDGWAVKIRGALKATKFVFSSPQ